MRITRHHLWQQPDFAQTFSDSTAQCIARQLRLMQFQPLANDLLNRPAWRQGCKRVLKNYLHLRAQAELDALTFQIQCAMRDSVALVLPNGKTGAEWKLKEGKALDHDLLKEALGLAGYRKAHKPWATRVFTLKPFAIDDLDPTAPPQQFLDEQPEAHEMLQQIEAFEVLAASKHEQDLVHAAH